MPFLVDVLVSPQVVILAAALSVIILEGVRRRADALPIVALFVYLGVAFFAVDEWFEPDDVSAANLVFLLVPTVFAMAKSMARSDLAKRYLQIVVAVAAFNAVVAVFEKLSASTVFGQADFLMDNGGGKGIGAADHPLILGVLLAATVFLVRPAAGRFAWVVAPIIAAGAWSTNAVGPTAIALIALLGSLFPIITRFTQKYTYFVGAFVVAVWVGLAYCIFFIWDTTVATLDLDEYSNQYRAAMYSFVPRMLADAPLGHGPGGMGLGVYVFDTALRGQKDLGVQVDSELVFLVADFGWIGVSAFAMACVVSVRAVSRNASLGLAALSMTGAGFFLSLHAWGSSTTFWVLLLGLAIWGPSANPSDASAKDHPRSRRTPLWSRTASRSGFTRAQAHKQSDPVHTKESNE